MGQRNFIEKGGLRDAYGEMLSQLENSMTSEM